MEVQTEAGKIRYLERENGLLIEAGGAVTTLSGARPSPKRRAPLFGQRPEAEARAYAPRIETAPALDGTREGFDCELNAAVSSAVSIPVIASGGAGTFQHFLDVFTAGKADAALAASVFHYSEHAVSELKQFLASSGIPVRLQHT